MRPYRQEDRDALVRRANDREVWRNVRNSFPHPYDRVAAEGWLARCAAQGEERPLNLAVEVDGELAGGVGLIPGSDVYSRGSEVGYWMGREFWGRGIATEAVGLLVDYAFERFDFVVLHAGVFGWNPGSMRVLEKNGFRRVGLMPKFVFKDGEFTDEVHFALLREEWEASRR